MPRGYKKIPSDIIERWRTLRANGAPLKKLCADQNFTDVRYMSKICLGRVRKRDGGPVTPKRNRPLTDDERQIVQEHVRQGLRIFGRVPSQDKLWKIIGHNRGGVVAEAARYTNWIERMLSYVAKAGVDECWLWTSGVNVYKSRKGIDIVRPRYMVTPSKTANPTKWLFDYWKGRPGRPLTNDERLKQTCGNLLCVNPRHQQVVTLNRKKKEDVAAAA